MNLANSLINRDASPSSNALAMANARSRRNRTRQQQPSANPTSRQQSRSTRVKPTHQDSDEVMAANHGFIFLRQLGRGNYGCVHLAKDIRLHDDGGELHTYSVNSASATTTTKTTSTTRTVGTLGTTVNMERMQGILGKTGDLGTVLAGENVGALCVVKVGANKAAKEGSHIEALQEVRVLRKLRHPCIVQFMDSFLSDDLEKLFIVMEYCDSGVLADRIKEAIQEQQWIKENKLMGWFSQLCSALDFLHRHHILHRDIKPDNVFMSHNGQCVKLGDFGFTRVLDDTQALALTRCGTPFYMSPEQCLGHPYNSKADAWASGIVLYELVTLQLPFNGKSLPELRQSILHQPPKRPPTHYSKGLCDLMLALLQRTPQKRPSLKKVVNMPIVKQALHHFVQTHAAPSSSSSSTSSTSSTTKRTGTAEKNDLTTRSPPHLALEQRRNKLHMELVSTTQELHQLQQSQRTRSSTKRNRQPTPTKSIQGKSPTSQPRRGGRTYREGKEGVDNSGGSSKKNSGGQPPLYKRRRSDDMEDGGARQRELLGSLQDIKMQLYNTEMELLEVAKKNGTATSNALQSTASYLARSLDFGDISQQSGESTYSDDHFESDDDLSFQRESVECMETSATLSAIGKSMVQMGLDDSLDDNSLRLSMEMANSSSQLVHMTATPSGVLERGSPRRDGGGGNYFRRK